MGISVISNIIKGIECFRFIIVLINVFMWGVGSILFGCEINNKMFNGRLINIVKKVVIIII